MFKRLGALEKSSGGLNVSFLNTHPASEERVRVGSLRLDHFAEHPLTHSEQQLEAFLPEAFAVQAATCGGSDYLGAFGEAIGLKRTARAPWE